MQQFEDDAQFQKGDRASSTPDEVTEIVAKHWLKILGTPPSAEPDFSRAGGTSVDLVELQLRLLRDDSISLEMTRLPDPLTFDALVETVVRIPGGDERPTDSEAPSERFAAILEGPANGAQIEQWIAEKIQPESCEYLVPIRVRVPDGTTWAGLDAAIVAVVNAHPSLRTSIHNIGGQENADFIQRIHPPVRSSGLLSRPAFVVERDLSAIMRDGFPTMPTVESAQKWRAVGLVENGRIVSLLLVFHHVAVDDHSLNLIVRDLGGVLAGESCSEEQSSVLDWSSTSKVETDEALEWWQRRLESIPADLALERDAGEHATSSASEEIVGRIGSDIVDLIDERLREHGVMRSVAAIGILRDVLFELGLARDDRVAIGTPMSLRDHPMVFGTTGMFLNTVPVVMERTTDLVEVGRDLWETKRHRRVPYLDIVETISPDRTSGRSPWLDACIGIMESPGNSSLSWELLATGETPFPILVMARWTTDGLIVQCQVQHRFGGGDLAGRIVEEYTRRLERLAAEEGWKPAVPSQLDGPRREPEGKTVLDLFSRQAAAIPNTPAIHDARTGVSLDYGRVRTLSDRIAAAVVGTGHESGTPVTLLFDHGPELAIAMLGVMKAGGVAMPLPADTPAPRLNRLIGLANSGIVVGSAKTIAEKDFDRFHNGIVDYDQAITVESSGSAEAQVSGFDAAYVLFTSGSTGDPKPVLMSHDALANLVEFEVDRSPCTGTGRCAQFAAVGFDVSLQEIFATWARGETLYPVPDHLRSDPAALIGFIGECEISRIHLPPLMARAIANASDSIPASVKEIICAGEALRIDDAVRAEAKRGSFRLVNQYGPTETHVVTSLELGPDPEAWPELPDIGTPIDGVTVRIEDTEGKLVDRGRSGEIVIEGTAVGIGYLGETQGGFERRQDIPRYRTGDMGRVLPNGRVEFLGRRDGQVKISGFRVEPAEVEAVIAELPGVDDSGVVAVLNGDDPKLYAFIEGDEAGSVDMIVRALEQLLPHWLVPSAIVPIKALPKTASGKVDRAALRRIAVARPESDATGGSSDPVVTELHRRVPSLAALRLVPGRPLGESGVDSLAAIRIQSALDRDFEISISVRDVLAATPSIILEAISGESNFARRESTQLGLIASSSDAGTGDDGEWKPLNPLVRDVLAKDAMSPSGVFHLAWRIKDPRSLDIEEFGARFEALKDRWPTLRSRWSATSGTRVVRGDHRGHADLTVHVDRPSEEVQQQFLHHPIDLELTDPIRVAVWPEVGGGHVVLLVIHHVAADGVLAREMIDELLDHRADGPVRQGAMTIAPLMDSPDLEDVGWWIDELESSLGGAGLPVTENRFGVDAEQSYAVAEDVDLQNALHEAGRRLRHGRIACALASWAVLLGHRLGRDRLVIGVPFAMDSRQGLAANMLPIVIDLDGRTIIEVLDSISGQIGEAIEHRRSSFGAILNSMSGEHDHLRPPVDAVLTIDDLVRDHESGALVCWEPTRCSSFQASAVISQSHGCSFFGLEAERGFLDGEDAESMLARWLHIMRVVVESSDTATRDSPIASIDVLTPSMLRELEAFGDCEGVEDLEDSVLERFDRLLDQNREGIAIVDGTDSITYGELDAWSSAIADRLISCGVERGDPVAIASIRRISTVVGLLGVLRAGGWFVPIEKGVPLGRRLEQIKACGCTVGLQASDDECLPVEMCEVVDPESCRNSGAADTSRVWDSPDRRPDGASPMYGMFTSGTTGEPRCAVVPHRAVLRLVADPFFLRLDARSRVLNAAPLAFDASTIEIWGPLLNGGTIAIWTGHSADLAGIADFLKRTGVDTCWLTTALFNAAVDTLPEFFRSISTVMTGGDVVSIDHVRRLMAEYPRLTVVNGYGPTENTVFTSCEVVPPGCLLNGDSLSVGRAVRGTRLRIVDEAGRLVPRGRFGQLVVEGEGLALGYLGAGGKPEASGGFRWSDESSAVEYCTGDYVRWMRSGLLQFGGRRDHQVKIGGHRIELVAVDHALRSLPAIGDACSCIVKNDGRTTLAAVVVPVHGGVVDEDGIRADLEQSLLPWEIPSSIVRLNEIPITANGKPDRAKISEHLLAMTKESATAAVARPGDLMDVVLQTVQKTVAPRRLDPSRRLRDQGLDSLDMLRLTLELEGVLGRPVHLSDILADSSVDSIVRSIAKDLRREAEPVVTLHPGAARCRTGVFCIPGVGGTVFSFDKILDGLPSWCPVHGLPYPGISGDCKPESRVEDLADALVDASLNRMPKNPILVGYSFGGFVAFEFARRLAERGFEPVVVAIDAAPASLVMYRRGSGSLKNWKLKLANVLPTSLADRVGIKKSFAVKHLRAVVAASFEAIRHYVPEPLDVPVHLLRTRETDFSPFHDVEDLGWRDLTPRVNVEYLPGQHLDVFRVASMEVAKMIREIASGGRRDT